ncbi:DNA cytosine methyltransferase [Helicobacter cetorum]|uniref:Cytosine-specific methyltransferase n=2 Tax=Helicobacter cetorum TaxID=138563 RepID=I0EPJ3_HELC0|nr:DNA cytosine methyltransferase [Helicobacter cetorum]ABS86795.1 putative DNA methylase [Helicobacter cetorum]AFI04862.1 cytosine specific DNA methyltransferase [Helicobacter cetorum MIT 00-7128]
MQPLKVLDLFAGVGGFSKGFENANFNIVLANEIDKEIAYSYKENHKNTIMIDSDINDFLKHYHNLETKDKEKCKDIDVIIGGSPCQGFSMAGARIRQNKQDCFIDDKRNYLFRKYFEVIQAFEPKFFVFENVVGLASMNKGAILQEIESLFSNGNNFKQGKYYLYKKVFEVNKIGVPQNRKRLIILGSKTPFNGEEMIKKVRQKNSKFNQSNTIKDAISDLAFKTNKLYIDKQQYLKKSASNYQKEMRFMSNVIYNHTLFNHKKIALERMQHIKQGQNYKDLKEKDMIKSVHSGAYGRLEYNKQAVTITTRFDTPSAGRFIHPLFDRTITIREAARLQSFRDDFIFYGSKTSICKQIGNAVPPYLGEFLGLMIKEIIHECR